MAEFATEELAKAGRWKKKEVSGSEWEKEMRMDTGISNGALQEKIRGGYWSNNRESQVDQGLGLDGLNGWKTKFCRYFAGWMFDDGARALECAVLLWH